MPPDEIRRNVPLYIYDEIDQSFRSIGVLDNMNLVTDMAEMTNLDMVETSMIYDLAKIKIRLKVGLWTRLKLLWILKFGADESFLERFKSAILCSFQGLKYQIVQKFRRKKYKNRRPLFSSKVAQKWADGSKVGRK